MMRRIQIPSAVKSIVSKNIVMVTLLFSIAGQFSFVSLRIARSADSMAIINAMDDDAANAIGVAKKSYLLWDNGFIPYGNVYFRIAKLFNSLDPASTFQQQVSLGEKETATHFALMLTSLLFFFLITYVISTIITTKTELRLAVMLLLNSILFIDYNWVYLIFKAHPDIMLAFTVMFAFHLSVKYLHTQDVKFYWLAAIMWGIAVGTKAVAVFFLPGLILLFIPAFQKENLRKAFYFFLLIFAAYLLIGLPQNFRILTLLHFLVQQKGLSMPATQESVNEWIHLLLSQAGLGILVILVLKIILYKDTDEDYSKEALRLSPVFLVQAAYLFSQNITSPHTYYTLPLAATLMAFSAHAFTPVARFIHARLLPSLSSKENLKLLIVYAGFAAVMVFVPNSFQQVIKYEFRNREETRAFYQKMISYQASSSSVLIDPYVPFDNSFANTHKVWGITFGEITRRNATVLALNPVFYGRFLDSIPSHYVRNDTPDWQRIQLFYKSIQNKTSFTDSSGLSWRKTFDRQYEIWEQQK